MFSRKFSYLTSFYIFATIAHLSSGAPSNFLSNQIAAQEHGNVSLSEWLGVRNILADSLDMHGFDNRKSFYRQVLMVNGTSDDTITIPFFPEEGKKRIDYDFIFVSNDSEIVDPENDISFSLVESGNQINVTAAIDFNKFPGTAGLTLEARRVTNESLFDSVQVEYLAAGIAVYEPATRTIISGAGRSLTIPSHEDINKKPHWEFDVFIQFLNKTNSTDILKYPHPTPNFSISDITTTFITYRGQVMWDDTECAIFDGEWDGTQVSLKQGCGVGLVNGYVNSSYYDGYHFAYDFQKNRAGRLDILFEWEEFTMGSVFEDEEFTNYVLAEIHGQPPSVVKQIEPEIPFDQTGGQELYLEMINTADVNITSFNVNGIPFLLKPGSRKNFTGPQDFFESAKFLTEAGKGKRLPWTISGTRQKQSQTGEQVTEIVQFIDESGFLFSYDGEDILVSGVNPRTVSESGGDTVTISGKFPALDLTNLDHGVIIGNIPLEQSRLKSSSNYSIEFTTPPRHEIGNGWEYDVVARMGNSFSRPVSLVYEPSSLSVRKQAFGASSDPDSELLTVSSCDNTTYMALMENYNGGEALFSWRLLNSSNFDLLSLENASLLVTHENTLELPNKFIPQFNTIYMVVADILLGNLSATTVFSVRRSETIVVGVTLLQPENRTISSPKVNMRVVAKIDFPNCYPNTTTLTYEWEYEDKTQTLNDAGRRGIFPLSVHDASLDPEFNKYVFSFENNTGTKAGEITPTRLGRELIIPRKKLEHGVHRIRLTVRAKNDSRLYGYSSTSVTIFEGQLIATIGTGQISKRASDAEDLYVSGQASFDPDVLSGNPSSGLSYEWSCHFFLHLNLSFPDNCSDSLLPQSAKNMSAFTVGIEALQNHSKLAFEEVEGEVYIQYNLTVRKGNREGKTSQAIAVVNADGLKLASCERIELLNSLGERLDHRAVPFWEDVIIRPVASLNTEWRFRMEQPISERSTFFASSSKLLTSPGYYTVAGRSDPGFQRLPLGIKEDQLSPHQEYTFSISIQEPGKISDEVSVRFQTVEVPSLLFPRIGNSNGTVSTIFRTSATTTFLGNACYTYQFYLMEVNKTTREYCVDGCTGANAARFQVAKPGQYVVQCRLLCATGKKLLAVANNSAILSVTSSASVSQADQFDKEMDRDYMLGDDGAVNQKGFFVTESMHEEDGKVVAMSDDPSNDVCSNYTRKWVKMSRVIVGNELPNTPNARNYISLATNFARLKCVESDTLYELLGMVDESISRTPSEETLTTVPYTHSEGLPNVQLEEELLRFYNFSMTRALSSIAGGSSRSRISPLPGEVNNLVLELSEMWMRHITASATSGRVCGWDATYTSSSVDGEPDSALTPSRLEPPLGVNTIRVAVMCNSEQGTSLSTPFASFHWCDSVYSYSSTERMLITMAESFDYPYLSGIQGTNRSDSRRLIMVDITTLGKDNQLVSAMSDDAVFAQAENEDGDDGTCYRIGLTMGSEAMTRSDECSQNVPYHMWPRKSYGKSLEYPFESSAYQRRTIGVKVTPETRNDSATVIAQSNILGLYGAYRTTCDDRSGMSPLTGLGVTLGGLLIGILLMVIVITGLTYALVSALIGVAVRSDDGADAMLDHYIERDFFGRGQVRLNLVPDDGDDMGSDDESEYTMAEESENLEEVLDNVDSMDDVEAMMPEQTKLASQHMALK